MRLPPASSMRLTQGLTTLHGPPPDCHVSAAIMLPRTTMPHAMLASGRRPGAIRRYVSRSMRGHLAGVAGVGLAQHRVAEAGDDAAAVQRVPHKLLHLRLARRLPDLHQASRTVKTWPTRSVLAHTHPPLTHTLLLSPTRDGALLAAASWGASSSA